LINHSFTTEDTENLIVGWAKAVLAVPIIKLDRCDGHATLCPSYETFNPLSPRERAGVRGSKNEGQKVIVE
jgi:hypothetical protein